MTNLQKLAYPQFSQSEGEKLQVCPLEFAEPDLPLADWLHFAASSAENWCDERGYRIVGYSLVRRKGKQVVTFWARELPRRDRLFANLKAAPHAIANNLFGAIIAALLVGVMIIVLMAPFQVIGYILFSVIK